MLKYKEFGLVRVGTYKSQMLKYKEFGLVRVGTYKSQMLKYKEFGLVRDGTYKSQIKHCYLVTERIYTCKSQPSHYKPQILV